MPPFSPSRRAALGLLGAAALPLLGTGRAASQERLEFDDEALSAASFGLVYGSGSLLAGAIAIAQEYGQPDILPAIILALRYNRGAGRRLSQLAGEIAGEKDRHGWFDWMVWQQAHPEITPHPSFIPLKLELLHSIDPAFERFVNEETVQPDRMRIRFEEISWGGVVVDGIPSLDAPEMITAQQADYLKDDDLVFGVSINGDVRAYPLRILNWHEMFNDVIGGIPVALAYCTLCGAGIVFETRAEGRDAPFIFGSSGFLYRSNKLMFDRETNSLWNQFTGKPVVGPLVDSGIELNVRPVVTESWASWREKHPDTTVLSLNTGHRRDYGSGVAYREYFSSDELMFPALADTLRLREKDYVFGIRLTSGAKAWPITAFKDETIINDQVGDTPVVLIGDAATRTVRAYARAERVFSYDGDGRLVSQDGAIWSLTEDGLHAPGGALARRMPGHLAFWFGWNGYLGQASELY